MSRCRETAGILFKKRCQFPSTQACSKCNKPICRVHVRALSQGEVCIACARTMMDDPNGRRSYAHMRDDPYFYWYFHSGYDEPYSDSDYALFDDAGGDFGAAVDDQWEGT
jgi:hypothetical protein